jgi:hypothetical protein
MTLSSYPYGYGAGLLLILSIGFPMTCRTKIKLQPCASFDYLLITSEGWGCTNIPNEKVFISSDLCRVI